MNDKHAGKFTSKLPLLLFPCLGFPLFLPHSSNLVIPFNLCFSSFSLFCSCQESSCYLRDLLNIRNSWYWKEEKKTEDNNKKKRELQVNWQPMPYLDLLLKKHLFCLIYSCFFLVRHLNLHRSKHGALWELQKSVNDLTPVHYCNTPHDC